MEINKQDIEKEREIIKDLQQQLAEKEDELNSARVGKQFALKCCNEAKEQLAESEKKREYLFSSNCEYVSQIEELKQDKISFAVEQLEKVKEKFISEVWDLYDTADLLEQVCELRNEQIKFIDNQIKQLKEMK